MRIVKNGDVHVSVPYGMPKKEVESFINQHQERLTDFVKKVMSWKKTSEENN